MSKTTIDVLTTELCRRMGWDVTAATTPRADALTELDRAEKYIQQRYSLDYLTVAGQSLSLANNAQSVALSTLTPTCDWGKDITIQNAAGDSELLYIPPDEWYEWGSDTYGLWQTDRPYEFALLGDGTGAMSVYFRPKNTTGGSLAFAVIYQRALIALVDANNGVGSTSLLPEGFEKTILLNRAEAVLKRIHHRLGWEELTQISDAEIEAFYGSYRTSKEQPEMDREQQERKIARDKLAPGV